MHEADPEQGSGSQSTICGRRGLLVPDDWSPRLLQSELGEPQKLCGYLRTFTVDELAGPPKVRADQGSITYYRMANP